MTESDRLKLEQLKHLQASLELQVERLRRDLDSFERQLAASPPVPPPKPVEPVQPVIPRAEVVPPPVPTAPVARLVEIPVIPPPVIKSFETASKTASTSPAPEPVIPSVTANPIATLLESRPRPETGHIPPSKPVQPQAAPKGKEKASFEMKLGTFWLVRIGIVMVLTALAFFGTYAYQNFIPRLGPAGKVGLLYLASAALLGTGAWLPRKQEKLKNYSQVLLAGGLAAVYFTTYAAYHIPNLRVIGSALLDGTLLLGWAGFIIWLADRKKSEVLALFAVLLAYYTSVITNVGLFTLYSNLILAAAAVFFFVRNRWATLSFTSLAASYVSYGFWRFYQDGHWQWASPAEGLWTGNYFLICYWVIFTVAVFLSRHAQFSGTKRASFVSLNNGAFFCAFILTMFQVRQGGFWKFSLLYGTVLTCMAILAQRLFASDKILRNTYLTQGLLLLTLGFITKFTGLQLSLILAVESVALVVLGQQLRNQILQIGSYICAALSVGWAVTTMHPMDHHGAVIGSAVGALLLFNATWFRKQTTFETSHTHTPTAFFTILSLAIWLVTSWQNSTPEWRGVLLAAESTVLLLAARPLGNRVFSLAVPVFAGLGIVWELHTLIEQFITVQFASRQGLWQGIIVGALMLGNALAQQRFAAPAGPKQLFNPLRAAFTAGGLLGWLAATAAFTTQEYFPLSLAVEALLFTILYYVLRLPELTLFGQVFLVFGQVCWILESLSTPHFTPWWNPALIVVITLGLSHWWQRQQQLNFKKELTLFLQGIYALAAVGLLYFWLQPHFNSNNWLALTSLLAIVVSFYGLFTRSWLLVATGQIFLVASVWQFAGQLANSEPSWYLALAPIATLCFFALFTLQWLSQKPGVNPIISTPVLQLSMIYRALAVLMSLWWTHKYIPAREQCWFLMLIGFLLFSLAGWRRNRELLIYSSVFTLTGIIRFLIPLEGSSIYLPTLLALLLVPIQQRIAKAFEKNYPVSSELHAGAMILGALSLWLYFSRWVLLSADGFYLTAAWSGYALVLFIAGMAVRERVYRWLGLSVLACALGRVSFFDVWRLEPIYRILSFLALGIVLLVLGFLYNKYQEKIKEWL
ncbi:DUF2339 domain-containing protein [Pedosphaera parvula]|uniref:Membrane protein-like protein n=1 Tax=Pedosphaera parvula (strain Ellin514) TaxID=320771 RepID=B9XNZ5_PEDPL|nr:DUF2339 domain-containing protein [Pedosphaera parvula]EEF58461.1 membrane protein-like protein [Pedosphaera parvula Ellin514]